jgi:hypothetical protein
MKLLRRTYHFLVWLHWRLFVKKYRATCPYIYNTVGMGAMVEYGCYIESRVEGFSRYKELSYHYYNTGTSLKLCTKKAIEARKKMMYEFLVLDRRTTWEVSIVRY